MDGAVFCLWRFRGIYKHLTILFFEILKDDYYLWLKESDQTMIVEDRKIESDAENGNHFTVTGRSLESILERRIIWKQTILSGNFQNGIKKLLDEEYHQSFRCLPER